MKLVFCLECQDLFKLSYELRACKCGKCCGKYEQDGAHAVTNGEGICVAISNPSLWGSISALEAGCGPDRPGPHGGYNIEAWIRPHEGEMNPRNKIDKNLVRTKSCENCVNGRHRIMVANRMRIPCPYRYNPIPSSLWTSIAKTCPDYEERENKENE
jgi:hypothetical protein